MTEATMTPDELRAWAGGWNTAHPQAADIARRLAATLEKLAETEQRIEAAEHDQDMANVGCALMGKIEAYENHPALDGWSPAECPSEIVGDLLDHLDRGTAELDELHKQSAATESRLAETERERDEAQEAHRTAREVGLARYANQRQRADAAEARAGELAAALDGLLSITRESHGVYGFHLNGAGAPWNEFLAVQEAEAALSASVPSGTAAAPSPPDAVKP